MNGHTDTALAVEASGLVKSFGSNRAVDGIDLEIRRGEIVGVLGPNGAGKTTVLRMLSTLLSIDKREARIFGVDVRRRPHQVRQLTGVTGQSSSVDELLTARENLVLFGRLRGLGGVEQLQRGLMRRHRIAHSAPHGGHAPLSRSARTPRPRVVPTVASPASTGRGSGRRHGGTIEATSPELEPSVARPAPTSGSI